MLALYSLKKNNIYWNFADINFVFSFSNALKINRYSESLMIDQLAVFAECHDRPC